MNQTQRTLQEYRTSLSPAEVIAEAKQFFPQRNSLYAAFLDLEGPTFVSFRGQGGEELIIAAATQDGDDLILATTAVSITAATVPNSPGVSRRARTRIETRLSALLALNARTDQAIPRLTEPPQPDPW